MARTRLPEPREWLGPLLWIVGIVALLAIFPPFHIQPLGVAEAKRRAGLAGAIDVSKLAEQFWTAKLVTPGIVPIDAATLVMAVIENPSATAQKYGRRAGIGGKTYFLVSGKGRISCVDRIGVWVSFGGVDGSRLVLLTGPIFGNALRDATGLLDINDYNSFDFNALSAELNRLAEVRGEAALRSGAVGATISFIAAGQIDEASGTVPVLRLAPIRVETIR
jgi:predicted lipoprotein